MSKIYHQSLDESDGFSSSSKTTGFRDVTDGRKFNVVIHYGIFSSMLKNYCICTGWFARLSAHHATRL